ncbi:response regulator transcription factor [Paenibacillus sp. GCM10012307]
MQSFNDKELLLDDAGGFEEGAFCETTRRVVIISPFPALIRSLVMALTIRCYDVLVFHHENDPILATIESDLFVIDQSKAVAVEQMKMPSNFRSVLLLVGDEQQVPQSGNDHAALVWPCPIPEALEKIDQLANQNQALPWVDADQLRFKDITMDLKRFSVHKSGVKVELTKTEFNLLKLLLSVGGAALTRNEIMKELWGDDYFGGSNSVDVHIKSLRRKLEDDLKKPKFIITVRGVGYRISDE